MVKVWLLYLLAPLGFRVQQDWGPAKPIPRLTFFLKSGLALLKVPFGVFLAQGQEHRVNYLMMKQAKIVAMTCTYAALKRADFLKLGFKYDNLLMEEAAQILEIETFIPMLMQASPAETFPACLSGPS